MGEHSPKLHFILIDDSKIDLFIVEKIINAGFPDASVLSFEFPEKALEHIRTSAPFNQSVIFLDINMPVMDGFRFLEEFDKIESDKKEKYQLFILTSSLNANDAHRGKTNKYVTDVLIKPLSKDSLLNLRDSFKA